MKKQLILTIGRQYGSNGHEIGVKLAHQLGIEFYDKAKLIEISKGSDHYEEMWAFYEERPVNSLLFAISMNQMETHSSDIPFTRIERLFQEKGGILIGRCGNAIFRENKRAVRIFIHADPRIRQERISQWEQIPLKKAAHRMQEVDEERMAFHQYFARERWGQADRYEICLDSGILGVDGCVETIIRYLDGRGLLA